MNVTPANRTKVRLGWCALMVLGVSTATLPAQPAAPNTAPDGVDAQPLFRDPSAGVDLRVDDLIRRLTMDEKIGQLMMACPAIPRLGIPSYDWRNEGLHGVARDVTTPITTRDILPTLLALSGVTIPKTVEGEDLSALLRAGRDADRAALYMCVSPVARGVAAEKLSEYRAIRTSRYTYVRGLEGAWLLFDDQQDAYQTNNLIGKAEFASMARELDDRLQGQLKRTKDDFRPGKHYIAEWGYEVADHGSVPYAVTLTKVQTPRRKAASSVQDSSKPNVVPRSSR